MNSETKPQPVKQLPAAFVFGHDLPEFNNKKEATEYAAEWFNVLRSNEIFKKMFYHIKKTDLETRKAEINKFKENSGGNDKNKNCINCRDCFGCVNCINCEGCYGCINCRDCVNCSKCVRVKNSENCAFCWCCSVCCNSFGCFLCNCINENYGPNIKSTFLNQCYACENCQELQNSELCENCFKCISVNSCRGCSYCFACNCCRNCKNCKKSNKLNDATGCAYHFERVEDCFKNDNFKNKTLLN